ncbi:MAG TPA: M14 family zinc carboxypeptidase [Gaiellaceae bacterium]|nr:M14 family zinc carboxypeptidase [Gaiellaceae bacterium]
MTSRIWRAVLAVSLFALVATAGAAAAEGEEARGIDPNQGDSLVEVTLASKGAAMRLQLSADKYGIDFNEHYLRNNRNGTVTVSVFGSPQELAALEGAGYDITAVIENQATWRQRMAERAATIRAERRAAVAARTKRGSMLTHDNEIVVLRVDYFENYAGRFLSVEVKDRLGGSTPTGSDYVGPAVSLSWNYGPDTPINSPARVMDVNIDGDTSPDTYIEHRELVRIGDVGTTTPAAPTRIRVGSSTGASIEAPVNVWVGGGLPPMSAGRDHLSDFTTHYMDPTEVYKRFDQLAAEYSNIAELIPLPYATNGYQRKAMANMYGTRDIGLAAPPASQDPTAPGRTVVLISRAWGHEGGNNIRAALRNPGTPNAPLTVSAVPTANGHDINVDLGTDASGNPNSTAVQVVNAINASPGASALVRALTYRGNAGGGVVPPRAQVNLSDFLAGTNPRYPAEFALPDNSHVARGPFRYSVMRIGKVRDGSRVGVYLYCQQHAREWATPLTCLETAEQLLHNYAIDSRTRQLVDNLDIFILPSSNPDGSHYSMYNFSGQRRNLTNYCVNGAFEDSDPFAANFWTPRINPAASGQGAGLPYTNTDAASRNLWGVDLNRNNTVGTIFDGYIGASHSCTNDTYAGPAEVSEPEMKNEHWIADTFSNIKFSNNIHSFGGYFMWAPGTYLPNRDEGDADHANIGVEKYFFAAGDRILNRIKEHRGTVILPERTGPVADVLYSAAGNSADEHWYRRGTIAYSFETGADRYVTTTLSADAAAGATAIRAGSRNNYEPGDVIVVGAGTENEETRIVESVANPSNTTSPLPNLTLTQALSNAHTAGEVLGGGTAQQGVGFQPPYATEGKHEALEFALGNFGLLESALEYARDTTPPEVRMTGPRSSRTPIETTFEFVNEPSVIRYTTDGSAPTATSTAWDSSGTREPGQVFHVTQTTVFRWRAVDLKGNVSTGSQRFTITP